MRNRPLCLPGVSAVPPPLPAQPRRPGMPQEGRKRLREDRRRQPREERRGQLAIISRLPGWALDLWRQFRSLPATELRTAIEALRGLARLLEDVLTENRQAELTPALATSSCRAASA